MKITLQKDETADMLADGLSRPIMFRVMREAGEDEEADIENEQFGRFNETGITESHVEWVTASTL